MLVPYPFTRTEVGPGSADFLGAACSALPVAGSGEDRRSSGGRNAGSPGRKTGTRCAGLGGAVHSPTFAGGGQSTDKVPGTVLSSFRVLGAYSSHTTIYEEFYR